VHVGPEALTTESESEPGSAAGAQPQPQPDPGHRDVPAGTPPAADHRPTGHPAHPRRCHLEDGPAISPATAQRIACQATVSWMLHDHDGTLLDVGRRHRRPPPALRRAVRERDRYRCQFPGCHSRRTDIHHIRHWAKVGKTRLRGLISLCEAHHMIVHALGYLITPADGGRFTFTRPDGTVLPASPPLPEADGDITSWHDADITADTIIPAGLGDKLDLELAIWACFANARVAEESGRQQDQDQQQEQELAAWPERVTATSRREARGRTTTR
jgi:Domain of unknown function (DUF222)